jgi:WXG100 family type VII secretion target
MSGFTVTPAMVRAAGTACNTTEAEVAGTLATLKTFVQSMESYYKGAASVAFQTMMVQWDADATKLTTALTDIATNLISNANIYSTHEEQSLVNVNTVSANL